MKIYKKNIYNVDNEVKPSIWLGKKDKPVEFPKLTSALRVKESKWGSGIPSNSFSTLACDSNNIATNTSSVYLINGGLTAKLGKHFISEDNFYKCLSLFTARNVKGNWVIHHDEYIKPNENI